ncbi:MAG: hypothetical protein QOI64_527 [Solirubrobacteraceae bacterium]|jgi:hypothetical protein|nr:hypothetical protein [Solirubrobacteraceae bacterium]
MPEMLVRSLPMVLVALLAGCGGPDKPDDAVKRWARAINERKWGDACDIMVNAGSGCERSLQKNFKDSTLKFDGPAINGGGTEPGAEYFSLTDFSGSTVTVTALPMGSHYAVRLEAVSEGSSG